MQVEIERDPRRAAELRAGLASYRRDSDALLGRWDELMAAHPDEWVSMHNGDVFHAPKIAILFEQLSAAGIDPASVPREFLGRDKAPLLL